MMSTLSKPLGLACMLAICALAGLDSRAETFSQRQYYSSWSRHPTRGYHYRHYYFKPTPTYTGFKHHFAIHFPQRPQHVYFYNPYKKQYWGRCPANAGGKPLYSLLAEKDRRGRLDQIPESAFPEPAGMPAIPESSDGVAMDLPPDDLPSDDALPE